MTSSNTSRRTLLQQAFTLHSSELGRRVMSGATFQFLGIVLRTMITIGSTAILARLLLPSDFGYIAMATVVTELVALFANFGWANILIQRVRITRLQLDTVFWASALLGALLALVVFALSYVVGLWFGDPAVGALLRVLCWGFVLGPLTAVPWIVLARLMRFRTEFWIQFSTTALRTAVAIGCAWAGMGAWSLVAGALTGGLMQAMLGLLAVQYRPRMRFQRDLIASTWRTSGSYFGGGLLFYTNVNVDLILIGRRFGAESLGYYQNARSLTDEIRSRIAIPLQHVLFPAFASVQNDPERAREMLLRSGRILAAVVVPIGIGVAAMAQDLVPVLYGDRWLAMIPLLTMSGITAAIKASLAIASPVINANNRVAQGLRYEIIGTVITVGAILLAIPHGIVAVATAIVVGSLYGLIPYRFGLSLLGMGWLDAWRMLGPPFVASFSFWGIISLVRTQTVNHVSHPALALLVHSLLATLIYVCLLFLLSRSYWQDLVYLVEKLRGRRTGS